MQEQIFLTLLEEQLGEAKYLEAKSKLDAFLRSEENKKLFARFLSFPIDPDFQNKEGILRIASGRPGCGCYHLAYTLIIDESEAQIKTFGEGE